jgi:hypothetical protein
MARRRSSRILPGPKSGSGSESVSLPPLLGRGGSAGSRTSCSALRGLGGTPPPGCEGEGGRGESRGGGEGNWEERGRGRGMCVGSGVAAGGVDWLWGHLMTLLCCGWGTRFCCVSFFLVVLLLTERADGAGGCGARSNLNLSPGGGRRTAGVGWPPRTDNRRAGGHTCGLGNSRCRRGFGSGTRPHEFQCHVFMSTGSKKCTRPIVMDSVTARFHILARHQD